MASKKSVSLPFPDRVTYLSPGPRSIKVEKWDDDDLQEEIETVDVKPAFVVQEGNEKPLKTARDWVSRQMRSWEHVRQKDGSVKTEIVHRRESDRVELTVDNKPIRGIRILSLEHRGNGGRAYKVVVPVEGHDFYCDLREDVLVDLMKTTGILPGAVIDTDMVWVRRGDMKLVRVGSALHINAIEETRKAKSTRISLKSLVPGRVYATRNDRFLYLGKTTYVAVECAYRYVSLHYYDRRQLPLLIHDLVKQDHPACHTWLRVEGDVSKFDPVAFIKKKTASNYYNDIDFSKSRDLIEDLGSVQNFDVCRILEALRDRSTMNVKSDVSAVSLGSEILDPDPTIPGVARSRRNDVTYINGLSLDVIVGRSGAEYATLQFVGYPEIPVPDFWKTIIDNVRSA